MAKRIHFITILLVLLLLIGCSSIDREGIESFNSADCEVQLLKYLFPDDGFPDLYHYKECEYQYHDPNNLQDPVIAFAYFVYAPEDYNNAKTYCIENWEFCELHHYEHNDFTIFEHLSHHIRNEDNEIVTGCDYPNHFNMFAYNDSDCTLLFLGYYSSEADSSANQLAQTDFGAFYEEVFSQYYVEE